MKKFTIQAIIILHMFYVCIKQLKGLTMYTNSVSFQGRNVPVLLSRAIENSQAPEIASAFRKACDSADFKPVVGINGKDMVKEYPKYFDPKTACLTPKGKECFNKINAPKLGIKADSTLGDMVKAIRKYVTNPTTEEAKHFCALDLLG